MPEWITPYRKWVKGNIYRWVIQLPPDIVPPGALFIVSRRPLIISELPELPRECDEESVRLLREKIESKTFRKAVGAPVVEAIRKLLEACE